MAVGIEMSSQIQGEEYKIDSNEALSFKLVTTEEEVLAEETAFKPEMSHQVFGDSETIFGYKNLEVQLYYHAGSLLTYLGMKFEKKVPKELQIPPDPVIPSMVKQIPEGYCTNLDEFMRKLPAENDFKPMGEKIHEYPAKDGSQYEIYLADINTPRLPEYHQRLQTFILWYIDAASFIDADDDKWQYFLLFKKIQSGSKTTYQIVGYTTAYQYYAYPDKIRPRISQMLIMPPHQKQGHGAKLLEIINSHYISDAQAVDINVEDPSEDFVSLRDYIDCKHCMKLDAFHKSNLTNGYSKDMETQALATRKIHKKQARRVYEILRYHATKKNDKDSYRDYRLDVKKRLNIPFQKQARDMKKLQKHLSAEEFHAAMVGCSREERINRLDEAFKELEQEYSRVAERLKAL